MPPGYPGRPHESGAREGIIPPHTASSLCFFKGTSSTGTRRGRGINISGVDFWHAVEFSRNGRFLRTHPLGLSSGHFPFGVSNVTRPAPRTVPGPQFVSWPPVGGAAFRRSRHTSPFPHPARNRAGPDRIPDTPKSTPPGNQKRVNDRHRGSHNCLRNCSQSLTSA
jgi:hypothetical protein